MFSHNIAKNYNVLTRFTNNIIITNGIGSRLIDMYQNSYLDATSSYCSANLGHQHDHFKKILIKQLDNLSICPRYVENNKLNNLGNVISTYFSNKMNLKDKQYLQVLPSCNGVDTVETAIKLSRAWGFEKKGIPLSKSKQIFMDGNFHGRTLGAISVNNYDYQHKFYPKVPNLINIPFNDIENLKFYLEHSKTHEIISAIFVEPIQCEGGINIPDFDYLYQVRKLCDKYNILLVCDEIQTGLFRTGKLLCSEKYNVKPDVVLLGKSLGGGYLPVSVCISSNEIMSSIKEGEHGSTFGGYPLGSAMAAEVIKYLHHYNYEKTILQLSSEYYYNLKLLQEKYKFIKNIKIEGFLFGIELDCAVSADKICSDLTNHNILIRPAKNNTIRLSPPFIITSEETKELFDGFNKSFDKND
jgi:ornithine--oxo-acid transaminase